MHETDLPCSDCGTELVARTVHARDLPVATHWRGTVRLAACPLCGARYYPAEALSQLTATSPNTQPRGDS